MLKTLVSGENFSITCLEVSQPQLQLEFLLWGIGLLLCCVSHVLSHTRDGSGIGRVRRGTCTVFTGRSWDGSLCNKHEPTEAVQTMGDFHPISEQT